ncbi:MAG: RNA methyltransferase [Prevotella sp.]|nr:RNA methyltransferase [Prevotella sp.]
MGISKNLQKLIRSLETKKGRRKEGLFVAEGPKVVGDLMDASAPVRLIATAEWFASQAIQPGSDDIIVTEEELRKVSFLQHPQQVMGLFAMEPATSEDCSPVSEAANRAPRTAHLVSQDNLHIALDGVQDPGNLGTIIRIADWFGIEHIFCSPDTVDVYNPKVVQATMGSIARVHIHYLPLPDLFASLPGGTPVYGTFLDGENLYEQKLSPHGIIVMGNEGNGISPEVAQHINRRLLIPNYPPGRETADSLNVAIATAITCAEFRRRS